MVWYHLSVPSTPRLDGRVLLNVFVIWEYIEINRIIVALGQISNPRFSFSECEKCMQIQVLF